MNDALQYKRHELVSRKGVVFHHDNAISYTSLVPPHPSYSPDIAPSDYHLFRSLQNLAGKTFVPDGNVKTYMEKIFAEKDQPFYERELQRQTTVKNVKVYRVLNLKFPGNLEIRN